ncbi:MAG: hypothetical protein PHF37_03280 [Phycisphaerae bacterium]|nr:hypothetical protein [Phycisphaerae bacterium]
MSLTQAELNIANQALDRIAAAQITLTGTTANEYLVCNRHYAQTRDSLLRSFEWPFATDRATLSQISTLELDTAPGPDTWAVGDVITGITSGTTAEILTVTSDTEYEIIHLSGDFTDGETITNADVEKVYWQGIPLTWEDEPVYWYDDSDCDQVVCGTGYPIVSGLTPDFEWGHQYQLPNDFVRLKKVYEDDGTDYVDDRFEREGQRLLTNYDTCNIKYIKDITDPTKFDALFTEVLILRLAMKLVNPLAGIRAAELKAEISQELRVAEFKAKLVAEQEVNVSGRSDFTLARYSS